MPTIQVTVDIKEDGQTLPGFPLTKMVSVLESRGRTQINRTAAPGFNELPLGDLDGVTVLFVQADQDTTLRFNDQTDEGLAISANGYFLMVDGDIPVSATSKASIENDSGSTAQITQVAAGS